MHFEKDLLVLRADHYSAACHRLLLEIQATGRLDAIVVADTRKRQFHYAGIRQVTFSEQSAQRIGLPTRRDMQWRCGDYAYYLAATEQPKFRHLWLIETDLRLCFANVMEFFDLFEHCQADYLTSHLGPARENWSWTQQAKSLRPVVYQSFFPLTRISRRACTHLLGQRQLQPDALLNDESFAATVLVNDGFDCRDLESHSPGLCASPGFSFDYPVLEQAYDRLANTRKIYHPVLRNRLYLKRLKRYHRFPRNAKAFFGEACDAYGVDPEQCLRRLSAGGLSLLAVVFLCTVLLFDNPEHVEDTLQFVAMLATAVAAFVLWQRRPGD